MRTDNYGTRVFKYKFRKLRPWVQGWVDYVQVRRTFATYIPSNDPNDNRCLKILDRLMQLEAEDE